MGTTAYAISDSHIIGLAWDYTGSGYYNSVGSKVCFKFTGNTLEIDPYDPFAGGGNVRFIVYVDGVAQPRMTQGTTAGVYQTAWSGSEGTHDVKIVDDHNGSTNYASIANVRITSSATESIDYPADMIATKVYYAVSGGSVKSTTFQVEGPTLNGGQFYYSNGVGGSFFMFGLTIRFKAKTAKIRPVISSFTNSNLAHFRLYTKVGSAYVAGTDVAVTLNAGWNDFELASGLDDTVEHEYIFQYISSNGANQLALWGFATSSGTGITSAHGYGSYRNAYVFHTDSLGDSADGNSGTGQAAGYNYWPTEVCRRDGVACVNFAHNGGHTPDMAADINAMSGKIPMTVSRVYVTGGRNDRFGSYTTTQTHDGYKAMLDNAGTIYGATVPIEALLMFYTGDSTQNATDDTYIAAEVQAITDNGSAYVTKYDHRAAGGPGLIQPDDYSGTSFTAHLAQTGNDKVADWLAPTNSAPDTPTITAGTTTATTVTLTGSAYSDPDSDLHAASQWQVTEAADTGYAATVIDTGDDASNLESYAATGLTASTDYIARVRYKDDQGNYSDWSTDASFTTGSLAAPGLNHRPLRQFRNRALLRL